MALGQVPGMGGGDDDGASGDGNVFAEINITPLTDIFLVLLIIFMVTSSVIVNAGNNGAKTGLKVNLPKGGAADVTVQAQDLSVAIVSDGRILVSGTVVTMEELKKVLDEQKVKNPETLVVVQADEGVTHGKVVEVMELAKGAGLSQLAIGVREAPK